VLSSRLLREIEILRCLPRIGPACGGMVRGNWKREKRKGEMEKTKGR
jgi:hypothetical protein